MATSAWQLKVLVTDLNKEMTLGVKGETHVGGVMLKLVEMIDVVADWSDHSFYWPDKQLWLASSRKRLDHYGVHADALLHFTPMHKMIKIQLPDLQTPVFRINFSINVFTVVIKLCKELGIKHPEELSLMRLLHASDLKKNQKCSTNKRESRRPTGIGGANGSTGNLLDVSTPSTGSFLTPDTTLSKTSLLKVGQRSPNCSFNANGLTPGSLDSLDFKYSTLIGDQSNLQPNLLPMAKNVVEAARINSAWLDSSRSLMEQDVGEVLLLRYKFYNFFDLHLKDSTRLHYIYEQAKSTLLTEEVECTEADAVIFAALQLHIEEKSKHPEKEKEGGHDNDHDYDVTTKKGKRIKSVDDDDDDDDHVSDDEVDNALMELQMTLEQCDLPNNNNHNNNTNNNNSNIVSKNKDNEFNTVNRNNNHNHHHHHHNTSGDITKVPVLQDFMKCYRPRKFHMKSYKNYWFTLKDLTLLVTQCKPHGDENGGGDGDGDQLMRRFNFAGFEDTFTVSSASRDDNYVIKLILSSNKNITELWIRQEDREQHIAWFAAFRTLNKGSSMADTVVYETERKAVIAKLDLLKNNHNINNNISKNNNKNGKGGLSSDLSIDDLMPERLLPAKYLGKIKGCKQMLQRVLHSLHNIEDHVTSEQTKLQYIRMWLSLSTCGYRHFVIKIKNSKKEEILSIGVDRMTKSDIKKHQAIQTWMYKNIQTWSVNWDIKQVQVSFESEEPLAFQCLTADCKVIHEFLGGYIFLSMRSGDKNQTLDEELFHKLTGGWE